MEVGSFQRELMGKYKILKKLGEGSFGTVFLVEDEKDQGQYVLKQISLAGMTPQELVDCKKEISILSVLNNPYIVRYIRSFTTKTTLCIVMEYADGGDLHREIEMKREMKEFFDEDKVMSWFVELASGLKHVHDHRILHRDLKTQNIFLTSKGQVKLGDFGISRVMTGTMDKATTLVGTPYYLSPEMVNGQPYGHRTDIWALGVVLYEMLSLQRPFQADSLQMLVLRIIQGDYPPIPKFYSKDIHDLLGHMLEQDPMKRYSIYQVLKHPHCQKYLQKLGISVAEKEDDRPNSTSVKKRDSMSSKSQAQPVSSSKTKSSPTRKSISANSKPSVSKSEMSSDKNPIRLTMSKPVKVESMLSETIEIPLAPKKQQSGSGSQTSTTDAPPPPPDDFDNDPPPPPPPLDTIEPERVKRSPLSSPRSPPNLLSLDVEDSGRERKSNGGGSNSSIRFSQFASMKKEKQLPQAPLNGSSSLRSRPKSPSTPSENLLRMVGSNVDSLEYKAQDNADEEEAKNMSLDEVNAHQKATSAQAVVQKSDQVSILKRSLEDKLGVEKTEKLIKIVGSNRLDDATKAVRIQEITKGDPRTLAMVHAYIYMSR